MNIFARAWQRSEAWGIAWACGSFQYDQEWEAKYGHTWRRWFHNPKNLMDSVYGGIRFSIAIYPIALIREAYITLKEN